MNKLNEAFDALYYVKYHAMQAGYQYREPDKVKKITDIIDALHNLDAMIEQIDGIGGFRFK